jgi:predicted GTPase
MLEDYYAEIRDQVDRLIREVPRPNILTLGITGGGKSSLINHVFADAVAATGAGKPVTQGITFYDSPACGIGIFDSRGYEFGTKGEEMYYQETVGFAADATMQ